MKKNLIIYFLFFFITVVNSQTYISKQQAVEDLDFYNTTLTDVHFNPFLFVEKDVYYAEVQKIKAAIQDSIEIKDFIKSLYRLTSLMQDSHSGPSVFQATIFNREYKKEQFFPYVTKIHQNKLYITRQKALQSGIAEGAEILSINNVQMGPFLEETQNFIGGIPEFKTEMAGRTLSHYLFISGVKAPFLIEYREPSGELKQVVIEKGIPYVKALVLTMPGLLEGNIFKIIDEKVGYIDFSNMGDSWQELGTFLDSAFVAFRGKNIKHLAIDLRNNSGGNSMLADVLLSYLTEKKYRLMGIRKWKISRQYKDYLNENGNTTHPYLSLINGEMWEQGECEPQENNFTSDTKFDGDVYFLTGPFTFSSANMLASGVKHYQIAEIIGQPTGENTNDFGEVYSFNLPHSKILMNTTTSFDIGPGCDETIISPVIPDIVITNSLSDLVSGEDMVLKYVLDKAN